MRNCATLTPPPEGRSWYHKSLRHHLWVPQSKNILYTLTTRSAPYWLLYLQSNLHNILVIWLRRQLTSNASLLSFTSPSWIIFWYGNVWMASRKTDVSEPCPRLPLEWVRSIIDSYWYPSMIQRILQTPDEDIQIKLLFCLIFINLFLISTLITQTILLISWFSDFSKMLAMVSFWIH